MPTREQIVAKAREALGVRWEHQGHHNLQGLDCAGLVLWTARQLGIREALEEPPAYPRDAMWDQFLVYFRTHMDEIPIAAMLPGDVPIFRQHIFPCHCGIMTQAGDDPWFIHSYLPRRKVVEERYHLQWPGVTRTAFRYRGVV